MEIITQAELIERIESFCTRHGMAESRFGRDAVRNSGFVIGLRQHRRSPTLETLKRVADFMAEKDAALAPTEADSHPPFRGATAGAGPAEPSLASPAGLGCPPDGPTAASSPERPQAFSPDPSRSPSCATCSPTSAAPDASTTRPACSTGAEDCLSPRPTANPAADAA